MQEESDRVFAELLCLCGTKEGGEEGEEEFLS